MDFDTAHTRSRESTSFGGSKIPARGYARETRVTTRRRPLVDATSRDAYGADFLDPRATTARARVRARTRTRTVSSADRARARVAAS